MIYQFLGLVVSPIALGALGFTVLWFLFSSYKYKQLPEALSEGFKGSRFVLTRGRQSGVTDYFYDLDLSVTNYLTLRPIVDWYIATIDKATKELGRIDRLAFIEKDSGPVGAILLAGILLEKTRIPAIIVRLRRRLLANSIKGSALRKGDNVILISDVATSGGGIKNAVKKLNSSGVNVRAAIVLVSRINPEDLKELGIPLFYALQATQKEDLERDPIKKFIRKQIKKNHKEKEDSTVLSKNSSPPLFS